MEITLEESTTEKLSPLLEQIVNQILNQTQTFDSLQKDFLFILVIVSMIENGFLLVGNNIEVIDLKNFDITQLSECKSSTGIYQASFILSKFEDIAVKLIMSPLGSTALVNVVVNELNCDTYSICLPVSRYVVSPQATTIPMIFRDLKHFSTNFKNKVTSAVKSIILNYYGYASASLTGLPEELLHKILCYLPVSDILKVCKTCKRLKDSVDNEGLWYTLYKRDFQDTSLTDCKNWKDMYKNMYIVQQDKIQRSDQRAGCLHDYMDYSDYVSHIDNPMWNIIL